MTSNNNMNNNYTSWSGGEVPICPAPAPTYLAPLQPQSQQLNTPLINQTLVDEPSLSMNEPPQNPDQGFPVRLHYMLTDIGREGLFTHIVSWQPHGRCFVVHDKKQFVEKILGLWFRQSKWASFQRQLNLYGFKRLSHGLDKGGYYHELFLQDAPDLARQIQRHKVKGRGPRKPAQPEAEPNFYALPKLNLKQRPYPVQQQIWNQQGLPVALAPAPSNPITLRESVGLTLLSNPNNLFSYFSEHQQQMQRGLPSISDEEDAMALEALALLG